MFRAIYLTKNEDGKTISQVKDLDESELPEVDGGVTVDVEFSTINFKDGLAITGNHQL